MGTVKPSTKITASPSPVEVFTVFDTARYEHIPRKYAKIILSMKMDLTNISEKPPIGSETPGPLHRTFSTPLTGSWQPLKIT